MRFDPERHHRRSIRLAGHDYSSPGAYFVTVCTHQRQEMFGRIVQGEVDLNGLGCIVLEGWKALPSYHPCLRLDALVIMPNHLHGILVLGGGPTQGGDPKTNSGATADGSQRAGHRPAPTSQGLPEIMRGFKTFTAHQINQRQGIKGFPVWQRGYHERIIRNDGEWARIRNYIANNPLYWEKDRNHPVGAGL